MSFGSWFWEFFLVFFVFVPLFMLWVYILFDIFQRADLNGWQKVLWILALFCLPYFGGLFYMLVRPRTLRTESYASS